MRITNQYVWNVIFIFFFLGLVVFAIWVLEQRAIKSYEAITLAEFILISLASFRIIRLVVYDKIFAFFREQFYNIEYIDGQTILVKPERGPRRTLADLLSCPWCIGVWAGAMVTFFYFLTPLAYFPVLFLAISAVASFFQILANLIGWRAEKSKHDVESL